MKLRRRQRTGKLLPNRIQYRAAHYFEPTDRYTPPNMHGIGK